MTLLALVALATLELDHVDLLPLDLAENFCSHRCTLDVGCSELGRCVLVTLDGQHAIKHDAVGLTAAEVNFHDLPFAEDDLSSTVFNDGVHGTALPKNGPIGRESHIITAQRLTTSPRIDQT